MKIFMKYIIKSMLEKKSRTFLVIIAITLSAALFYASNSIEKAAIDMNVKSTIEQVGNADIMVYPTKESPSAFFNSSIAREKLVGQVDYIIDTIQVKGDYRISSQNKQNINLYGVTLENYNTLNTLYLLEKSNNSDFTGNQIVISRKTADKYGLVLGNKIEIMMNDVKRSFVIYGIAANRAIFSSEKDEFKVMVPYDTLSKYQSTKSKPNYLYIKANATTSIEDLKVMVEDIYPKYGVRKVFDMEEYAQMQGTISSTLNLMTIFVMFISVFIIYTVFKVITLEKIPIIGTFRSVGADKKMINKVLFLETMFYGIVGGGLACVLGVVILYGMTYATMPAELMGLQKPEISINIGLLISTFIIANLLCILSGMLPILKVSKISVKEIVLNNITTKYKKPTRGFKTGIAIIIVSVLVIALAPREYRLLANLIGMVATLIGMVILVPGATYYMAGLLEKVFVLFGNVGIIASRNIKDNKSITNSITLISIGISCIFMIGVLSVSLNTEIFNLYSQLKFDAWFSVSRMSQSDIKKLKANSDIKEVYAYHAIYSVDIEGTNEQFGSLEGANKKYSDYYNFKFNKDKDYLFEELSKDRNIIIGRNLAERLGAVEGDRLGAEFEEGTKYYTIIGMAETLMDNGNLAIVDDKYLKLDAKNSAHLSTLIKTNIPPEEAYLSLSNTFKGRNINLATLTEMRKSNDEANAQIMGLVQGFSIIALGIGIIGVINNLIISFLERQRVIAMYKSIGMSKKQVIQMVFLEALAIGVTGGFIGVLEGLLLVKILPNILLYAIQVTFEMHYGVGIILQYIVGAIVIVLVASILPASKSSKLNIIEAIKFE